MKWKPSQPLIYRGVAGVVTLVNVERGSIISNAQSLMRINGSEIRAFQADHPIATPIGPQSTSDEIQAVQAFLSKLQYATGENGHWGQELGEAVRAYGHEMGGVSIARAFDPTWIVWIPPGEPTVDEVSILPATDSPAAGTQFALLKPSLTSALVTRQQQDIEPLSEQLLVVSGVEFAVLDDGSIGQSYLEELEQLISDTPDSVEATLRPRNPTTVISVPPTAVILDEAGETCIATKRASAEAYYVPVEVVGGIPGATYLANELDTLPTVLANPFDFAMPVKCP